VSKIIHLLRRVNSPRDIPREYHYRDIPHPWLQVKCLKILQHLAPPQGPSAIGLINEILSASFQNCSRIIRKSKSINMNNAVHGILFESMKLIIHY